MSTKVQIRRDSASDWTSANPTLSAGEMGYEQDTSKMKVGDGTTVWNSLAYFAPPSVASAGTLTAMGMWLLLTLPAVHCSLRLCLIQIQIKL